jgi:hypothetical protein
MYTLNGKTLRLDKAFTTEDGRQFPRNWLRLSTKAERDALGIVETPDVVTPSYDQRFYWGPNNPKDHTQLVEQWVGQTKQTAGSMLNQSDWYIVRHAETGKTIPQDVLDYRNAVRVVSDNREVMIKGTTDTDQLYAVITRDFNGLFPWPSLTPPEPPQSDETPVEDTIPFESISGTSAGVVTGSGMVGGLSDDTITLEL